jgi:hypothetical protein
MDDKATLYPSLSRRARRSLFDIWTERAMLIAGSVARQAYRGSPVNHAQDARATIKLVHYLPTSCFGRIGGKMLSQL